MTVTALGAAIPARYIDRVYPGTTVMGQDLSGLTTGQAVARVQTRMKDIVARLVTFRLDGKTWVASAEQLGMSIDYQLLATRLIASGRDDTVARVSSLMPWHGESAVSLPVNLDQNILTQYLTGIGKDVHIDPVDARLTGNGPSISITPDKDGRDLDIDKARSIVMTAAGSLAPQDVPMPVAAVPAKVPADKLAATKDTVLRLTSEPIKLTQGKQHWELSPDDLTRGIVMPEDVAKEQPWLDPWWINKLVKPIVDSFWVPATDAVLGWDGGLFVMSKSAHGKIVDQDALVKEIIAAAGTDKRAIEIKVDDVAPAVDEKHLDKLGITGLITAGDSSFAGSSVARSTNVGAAAYWVSQTTIAPGAVFSFLGSLGPISEDRGYVKGKIISGNWYADDIGGGVCQVSTTVYRAALYAGFPFNEWHPHASRVSFYELDGWPIGVDAAIYQVDPSEGNQLDLKFTNTSDHWLLLQMVNNGAQIVCQLYGTPTDWTIDIPDPTVGDPISPPAPETKPTDQLPTGQRQVIQQALAGVDVTLYRTVTAKDGTVISQDTFYSPYQPMPQITEVGQ